MKRKRRMEEKMKGKRGKIYEKKVRKRKER